MLRRCSFRFLGLPSEHFELFDLFSEIQVLGTRFLKLMILFGLFRGASEHHAKNLTVYTQWHYELVPSPYPLPQYLHLEVLWVFRAPNISGHRKIFCRKAMRPLGSHGALVLCMKPTSSLPALQIPVLNYEISYVHVPRQPTRLTESVRGVVKRPSGL